MAVPELRCVVAGDSAVGKTTLIQCLTGKETDDFLYDSSHPVAHVSYEGCSLAIYDVGWFLLTFLFSKEEKRDLRKMTSYSEDRSILRLEILKTLQF